MSFRFQTDDSDRPLWTSETHLFSEEMVDASYSIEGKDFQIGFKSTSLDIHVQTVKSINLNTIHRIFFF